MVSKAESETQEVGGGLSGLEGLLVVVGLEVTTEGVRTGCYRYGEMERESSRF